MRITYIEISKFRSIEKLDFEVAALNVLCGLNSSGKSNVLRAIRFALLPEYSPPRMATNIPVFISSPNVMIRIKITFDEPTSALALKYGLAAAKPWIYEVSVKRNGSPTFKVNGSTISLADRQAILNEVAIIFVPAIRDIAGEGLAPFKRMLGDAIKKARGGNSVPSASKQLKAAISKKGKDLLSGAQFPNIGKLAVDIADLDFEVLLSQAAITVKVSGGQIPLESFGTGHQSQVVLGLYRQLGGFSGKLVIFQFEEPDNHMHVTAMRAIADDLIECSRPGSAQVFVTTHSPSLMNHFDLRSVISLRTDADQRTVRCEYQPKLTDREYRVALSQFGMKPAEAMTARKVVIVEGVTDVVLVRTLYGHENGRDPERDDILIVPAGGKEQASRLASLLDDLGVDWLCVFDYDASYNVSQPYFISGIDPSTRSDLIASLDKVITKINNPASKKSKPLKIVEAMRTELATSVRPVPGFPSSVVALLVDRQRVLSASERASLGKAIFEGKHSKWREPLKRCRVWLWSDAPEDMLVANDSALAAAETTLRGLGLLSATFATQAQKRASVAQKLHELAASPGAHATVISAIVNSGPLGTDQFKALVKHLA